MTHQEDYEKYIAARTSEFIVAAVVNGTASCLPNGDIVLGEHPDSVLTYSPFTPTWESA